MKSYSSKKGKKQNKTAGSSKRKSKKGNALEE
jgi:hypothetical protein